MDVMNIDFTQLMNFVFSFVLFLVKKIVSNVSNSFSLVFGSVWECR